MSPEQTGRTTFQPDHRTDLYSLGITFFVVLTQTMPFAYSTPMEIVHNVLNRKIPTVHQVRSDVPEVLSMIIEKLTNKSIAPFLLGQYDIASVFTLPSGCYGRRREIELISAIIRRTAHHYGMGSQSSPPISEDVDRLLMQCTPGEKLEYADGSIKRIHGSPFGHPNITARARRPTEMIAIYGNSGVGKSLLIRNIQQVAREYGYIAIAKFDIRQPTPYGCILRCLSIFLKNILAEPAAEIDRFAHMLKEQLGPQAMMQLPTLLLDNVPELRTILDDPKLQKPDIDSEMNGSETKMRFHAAFIEIFQVMVNSKFVTLFLEDLHQADEASIELLQSLIAAKLNFLVIITYRKDGLSSFASRFINNQNSVVNYVKIGPLEPVALMELVRAAMHRHKEIDNVLLMPLVDFIHKMTKGNPFYACQLLVALEKKGFIYFTWEQSRWEYSLEDIEKALHHELGEVSENIDTEFLVGRLKDLPPDGRNFLKWASFVGNNFSFETVRRLMMDCETDLPNNDEGGETDADGELSPPLSTSPFRDSLLPRKRNGYDAINGLQSALQQGFIQAVSNDEFRFTHDRYSQAAMMLAKPEKRDMFHLKIAEYFMNHPNIDTFWVADHLKAAIHLIKQEDYKSKQRAMLIKAGNKAYHSGAHHLAFSYYEAAEVLLTPIPWTDGPDSNYQETLHLYTRLAEISWFMGYERTHQLINTVLKNAKSAIDRAAAYRIQHRYLWALEGRQEEATILLECLHELGTRDLVLDVTDEQLRTVYESTREKVLEVGLENIIQLPICENRMIRTRLAILEELCLWAYWKNRIKSILCIAARSLLKTLNHGNSPSTGVGFVFFGIAATQLFKAYEFGQRLGEVGVALCDKFGDNSESARARYLYGAFLCMWKYRYRDPIPIFRQAVKQALLGGDRIYSTYSHINIVINMLFNGENMSDVLREAKICLEDVKRYNSSLDTVLLVNSVLRAVLALQGKTYLTEEGLLDDKEFHEADFLKEMNEHGMETTSPMFCYQTMKLALLTLYGYDEAAVRLGEKYINSTEMQPSTRHVYIMRTCYCLAMLRLLHKNSNDHTGSYITQIHAYRSKLKEYASHFPANLHVISCLIDAELSSLTSDMQKTEHLYNMALELAQKGCWNMCTGMVYEFAGEYYKRKGANHVGNMLLEKAVRVYRHTACFGKAKQLERLHQDCLPQGTFVETENQSMQTDPITNQAHSSSNPPAKPALSELTFIDPNIDSSIDGVAATPEESLLTLDVVDLATILKSSQVISSEMNFELLMKQMLGIILENSGAESGVIIIKENSSFLIMGEGSQTKGCEIFKSPKLLSEEADSIVTRVAHYAIHAQESLFIADIQKDPRFFDSAAIAKSVICTPITHKSAIVGCIYIEGAVGSLTSRHEGVLRLLSQQIGISVTNALLFKSIQKVTYANVKMIENQKAALEEARKSKEAALRAMKLKADFLANMSHELRTPFSGFYGMISLLSETSLDAEQLDIVHTAKESCEMLLRIIDDLLNFSKLEAGKVVLDLGPLVVGEVIADTIEILSSLAARKGLELAYIVDRDVPKTIIGDSSRLRQILTNLLGNAIKFTHEGGVVIKCRLDDEPADDPSLLRLKFEVVDTGIGIRPDQQRLLFEPFSQVDGSTTRMYGGTGLGLSICLQLVRLMMGTVGVESTPDEGSNFWFVVNVQKMKKPQEVDGNRPSRAALLSKHKFLMATYHDPTYNMLKSLLPEFQVKRTVDVQHAIAQALQEKHEILLLDIPAIPNSFIEHQLRTVDDDPECELHIVLLYTPATEGHKIAAEATKSISDRRGRLVKMAKPARRAKLLRTLEQLLDQPKTSPSPMQLTSNRMSDYFKADELKWFKQKAVLIAEDNMVAQKLLRKQLEKMGFIVESANNGEEAVQLWQQRSPQHFCIGFFDHHMPKCDGVEATKRIRALERENNIERLPIVALTADVQSSARDMCVNAGMDGYLTKPLIHKELASILREFCPQVTLPSSNAAVRGNDESVASQSG
ncbi:uncharacterized protein BYT42DRAFT_489941 [Radiomyces spectabilis]|uniref:uncharacterized protein n=1 Tax=Radiomyces spectabilis TaxID=64574 RepID=UPI00221FC644|nr:uncharacterized protein BYT42DRAFT_489941 [Radiomyces spectabilis]KAI8391262.1 hypothetical protein BYT42DRAFT_489941 [Radiomyces spectabilis]